MVVEPQKDKFELVSCSLMLYRLQRFFSIAWREL